MGITIKCYVGAPGNRGASLFPEGHTYSPPAKQAVVSLPLVGPCALPEASAGRFSRGGAGNAADLRSAVITCAAGTSAIRRDCCFSHQSGSIAASRLPAETCHWQLYRSDGYRSGDTHFLFLKKKQKPKTKGR